MDRRIEIYKRFHEGYGEILVQMNVEDTRLGVAEYVRQKHNLEAIELKWGQGAKCIGGEIKVRSLDRALELQKTRLYRYSRPILTCKSRGLQGTAQSKNSSAIPA